MKHLKHRKNRSHTVNLGVKKLRRNRSHKTLAERRGSVDTDGGPEYRYPIPFPKIKLNTDNSKKVKTNMSKHHTFKIVLIGGSRKLVLDTFCKAYKMTLGVAYTTFHCTVPIELIEEMTKDANMYPNMFVYSRNNVTQFSFDNNGGTVQQCEPTYVKHDLQDSSIIAGKTYAKLALYDIPEIGGNEGKPKSKSMLFNDSANSYFGWLVGDDRLSYSDGSDQDTKRKCNTWIYE